MSVSQYVLFALKESKYFDSVGTTKSIDWQLLWNVANE
jgi:hypothetical protein